METEELKVGDYVEVSVGIDNYRIGRIRSINGYEFHPVTIDFGGYLDSFSKRNIIRKMTDEEVMLWKLSN